MAEANLTVRELRRLWKPQKERLNTEHAHHPTNIRFHRACSWLQRVEEIRDDEVLDHLLLSLWTAFNALYGQWNGERQEPVSDVECWQHFLDRMLALDRGELIEAQLTEHKKLAMTLFDDEYLSRFFWQKPTDNGQNASDALELMRKCGMPRKTGPWSWSVYSNGSICCVVNWCMEHRLTIVPITESPSDAARR